MLWAFALVDRLEGGREAVTQRATVCPPSSPGATSCREGRGAPALVGAGGCAGAPPAIGDPGPELSDARAERSYQDALARVTEHREVYSGLDTRLYCVATYQSPEFREARTRRQAMFQTWPEPKLDDTLARERADAAQVHEVVFGVSLVDRRFDDFDSKSSIWRLSLATN